MEVLGNVVWGLGVLIGLAGLVSLIRPVQKLGIPTRKQAFVVFLAGSLLGRVGMGMGGGLGTDDQAVPTSTAATPAPSTATPASAAVPAMPEDEQRFIQAVQQAQAAFRSAPNELAQGGVRSQRRVDICSALPSAVVRDWVGQIIRLSSNNDGKGVLGIRLAKDLVVTTWDNDLADDEAHTLIEQSTAMFRALAAMKRGDTVRFSGSFTTSDTDCVEEQSLTLSGSITEPEFTFQFATVSKP